jgi:hypothetical protein
MSPFGGTMCEEPAPVDRICDPPPALCFARSSERDDDHAAKPSSPGRPAAEAKQMQRQTTHIVCFAPSSQSQPARGSETQGTTLGGCLRPAAGRLTDYACTHWITSRMTGRQGFQYQRLAIFEKRALTLRRRAHHRLLAATPLGGGDAVTVRRAPSQSKRATADSEINHSQRTHSHGGRA